MFYRYRIQSERKVAICSIHPTEKATLQCIGCIKSKIPAAKSYHCTSQCFSDSWQHHRLLHDHANSASKENGADEEEISGRTVSNSTPTNVSQSPGLSNGSIPFYPSNNVERNGGDTSYEVGRSKVYTPTAEDIGHVLKLECIATDVETRIPVGACNTILTSLVIPAPTPFPRRLIPVGATDVKTHSDSDGRLTSLGKFTVLSYNVLSDACATSESYSYCPSWALSWPYRRQNLLREIVGYHADILCLQKVCNVSI